MADVMVKADFDSVKIETVTVWRPDYISPSQWLGFWDKYANNPQSAYNIGYAAGLKDAKDWEGLA